ncbi:MAG: tyrosine-type recombinase/integrase [Bacteroidetes bacterium]|nr:tyrosine-type recombinase/integrase [Bacteroidota bacterium]
MPNIVQHSADSRISNVDSDDYLLQLWLRSKSRNSKDAYARDVRQFLAFVDLPLTQVKLEHIWNWLDHLESDGFVVSTIGRKLATIKSLFSFGLKVGYLPFNVGAAISLPSIPDLLAQRILSESDVRKLLAASDVERDSVLLKLFYASGARVSELCVLRWEHIQLRLRNEQNSEAYITLIGKGSKSRNVIVSSAMCTLLTEFHVKESELGFGSPTDSVFRSAKGGSLSRQQMWRIVKKATGLSGVMRDISPHWLRHAHASHSLDRGAPTHLVKETLGHKSLTTTSRYTHARPDDSSGKYLDI